MTIPQVIVEVGFTSPSTGTALHIGDPVRGIIGTATIGGEDIFTDVSQWATGVSIRRGATRADGPVLRYEAGTCTITLRNDDRRFDPTNLSGPYVLAGRRQVEPMRVVQIRATWGGQTWGLFRGFTSDWQVSYDGPNSSYVTVSCVDAFGVFASYDRNESGAVGEGEGSGARINRILDSVGWPAEDRWIDGGSLGVQSTTLASNALTEMQLVGDTELGHLFADPAGRVRFRQRLADQTDAASRRAQVTFGDMPSDGDTTINLVTNPSLEMDTAGWEAIGSVAPTLTRDSTRAMFGTYSLLATWGTGGFLPGVAYDIAGLTAGSIYTISVYVWVPTGSPQIDTIVADASAFGSSSTTKDQWERLVWTGSAPSTTLGFGIWPSGAPTSGQQVWIDGLQIEEGATATAYCDGTLADCEWDGPPHASTSRRLPELPVADAPLVSDWQSVANLISIARAGGTAQVVEDAASRARYLTHTYQRHDLLFRIDAESLRYAEQLLARASAPELRFSAVELKPTRDDRLWEHALGRQFGDRIRVRRRPPGGGAVVQQEAYVRGVEHDTDGAKWVTRLVLQAAPPVVEVVDTFGRVSWGPELTGNPGFEVDASGWLTVSAAGGRSTAHAHTGAASYLVTPDGIGGFPRVECDPVAVAGQVVHGAAWVRPTTGNKNPQVVVHAFTAGGTYLTTRGYVTAAAVAGQWTYLTTGAVSFADLPTAARFAVAAGLEGPPGAPAAGDTFHVDDAELREELDGWGTADVGGAWTVTSGPASDFRTDGANGIISLSAVNSERHIVADLGHADQEVVTWVTLPVTPAGAPANWGVLLRYVDVDNYLWVDAQVATSSTITLRMVKRAGGAPTVIGTAVSATSHSTTVPRIMRARVVGSHLAVKVWASTATEPAGWELEATDTFGLGSPAFSRVGAITRLMTGNTSTAPVVFQFHNYTATGVYAWA